MNRVQKSLFFLILIVFPFGQLLRLDLTNFIAGLKVQAIDLSVFSFVFFWFLKKIIQKEKFKSPPLFCELAFFGLIAGLSLVFQVWRLKPVELLGASFYLLRLLNFIAFFWAAVEILSKENLPIFEYLVGEGVVIAFLSLLQYMILPDTRFLFNSGWDKHYFRAIGTFLDPGFTGLLMVLAFIIWVVEFSKSNKAKNFLFGLTGFILLLAIGLTFSRLAYFSLFVGLGSMSLLKKEKRLYLVTGLILLIIIFFLPKPGGEGVNLFRKSSFTARSDTYKQSLRVINDHFLFGVGYNAYRYAQRDYGFIPPQDWQSTNAGAGTDNSFLFVLATTGVFGLLSFFYFWSKSLYLSFLFSRKNWSSLVLFASLTVLSISALAINCLFYPWVLCWLAILLAKFIVDNLSATQARSCFRLGRGKRF
ncbi:O-antigen ligase family protein [Candidatus Microgenomates bacterium]|nr:O-antigen ligase family protein [Candidatus Microgenomates bacterium]